MPEEPFVGEIDLFGFTFAPSGYAQCNGQLLSIAQNTALFSLIGTSYGGDGISTFALPNLQSRVAVGVGQGPGLTNYVIGEVTGEASHTLTSQEMPSHTHTVNCDSGNGSSAEPGGKVWAAISNRSSAYGEPNNLAAMNPGCIGSSGGSQAHENRQPFLVLNFCIALQGVFPSRN